MPRLLEFYRQLKQRRVIRTAVVYAALVWGALQVADLLAEAEFLTEATVKWLILLALVGFPLTLVLSWFFETPWRERKALSVMGDVAVILAIAVGVFLLAWQQYFRSFARPTVAIVRIEATDTRADTPAFSEHLAHRLRFALASRPELVVIGNTSSLSPQLEGKTVADKTQALSADYLVTGTLNQGSGEILRLNLQLFDASGELAWSGHFEDRLLDMSQFESSILNALWEQLPLPEDGLEAARSSISNCEYPGDASAIRSLVRISGGLVETDSALTMLNELIEGNQDNGLLLLTRARVYFRQLASAPAPRQPVLNNLARQDLERFELECSGHPAAQLERFQQNPGILVSPAEHESFITEHPNHAGALLAWSSDLLKMGETARAIAFARAATAIEPLDPEIVCPALQIQHKADKTSPAQPAHGQARTAMHSWMSCPDPDVMD